MNFYKIKSGDTVIDVNHVFLRWQEKHGVLVDCSAEDAQFIQTSDQLHIYHVPWLHKVPDGFGTYETIDAVEIDEGEYTALKEQLEAGAFIKEPDEIEPETPDEEGKQEETPAEKVFSLPEMRREIDALRDQNRALMAQNEMLEGCLLEMSEIIYR